MITIKFRRDQSYDWARVNPVLNDGEPGYENDTGKFKIGNGVARWLDLDYFTSQNYVVGEEILAQFDEALQAHVNASAPHPIYDDGPSLFLLYQNAKV